MRLRSKLAPRLYAAALVSLSVALAPVASAANPCVAAADSAQDLKAANRLREAKSALLVCSRATCNSVVRADCEKWLKEVDQQIPSIVVRTVDARGRDVLGAVVMIDDVTVPLDGTPVPIDPGPHVIKAKAKSGDATHQKMLAAVGEKARVVELRFAEPLEQDGSRAAHVEAKPERGDGTPKETPPAAADGDKEVLPIVLAAIGGVALGAFAYFEIAGNAGYDDLENGCYRQRACTAADVDPVKAQFVGAGISLGVSVVALTAAAILHFTKKSARGQARVF